MGKKTDKKTDKKPTKKTNKKNDSQPKNPEKGALSDNAKIPKAAEKVGSREARKGHVPKGVTNREFKLLIKPDGLERRRNVAALQAVMTDFCKQQKIDYLPNETAATGLRNITFYDTPDEILRDNRIILRVRASRKDLWVDEWCEVTLKCRHDDFAIAAAFDPTPHFEDAVRFRMRFKEEILRGPDPESHRRIYSNNAIINTVPINRLDRNLIGEVYPIFPGLKALAVAETTELGKVGGVENTILEAALPFGMIEFDEDVVAHCDLGVWFRAAGVPLIGELAFAYRVNPKNRKNRKAHARADKFFAQLQIALGDQLATGSTKTALVYGKPE